MPQSTLVYLWTTFLGSLIFLTSQPLQAQHKKILFQGCTVSSKTPLIIMSQVETYRRDLEEPGTSHAAPSLPVPLPPIPTPKKPKNPTPTIQSLEFKIPPEVPKKETKPLDSFAPPRFTKPIPPMAPVNPLDGEVPVPLSVDPHSASTKEEKLLLPTPGKYSVPPKHYPHVPEPAKEITQSEEPQPILKRTNHTKKAKTPKGLKIANPPTPEKLQPSTDDNNRLVPQLAKPDPTPLPSVPVSPNTKKSSTSAPPLYPEPKVAELPPGSSPWVVRVEVIKSMTHVIARGKDTEFRLICQNLKMQSPTGDILAEGDITISAAGLEVSCQRLIISWQDEWVTMDGNVRLYTEKDGQRVELQGNHLRLKLTTLTTASAANDPQAFILKTSFFRPVDGESSSQPPVLYISPLKRHK